MGYLINGIVGLWNEPGRIVMMIIGCVLIFLAIKKGLEPALLLPMGFGAILVNIPESGAINQIIAGVVPANGIIEWLFEIYSLHFKKIS